MFTVDIGAELPAYWRVIALDKYDGELWTLRDGGEPADELQPPTGIRQFDELVQQFTILDADPHWLPAAYHPVEVNLENALYVPESATLYLKGDAELVDLSYEVTSAVSNLTDAEKNAASRVDRSELRRYVTLPPNFPLRVEALAREITQNASTPWGQAAAIEEFLESTGGFTYDAEVARSHSIDRLEDFLFDDRTGYCEQFASAFAAMARSIGLPTRIAVGYSYGTPEDGKWVVRNKDAHAWPEVYFESLGWVAFEPTPGRGANGEGGTGDATERPDVQAEAPGAATSTTTVAPGAPTPGSVAPGGPQLGDLEAGGGAANNTSETTSSFRQFIIGVAVFGLVAARARLGSARGARARRVPPLVAASTRARRARPRARCVGAGPRTPFAGRRRAQTVGDTSRVRTPSRAGPRCRCCRAGADGAGQTADRGTVRARCADRPTTRRTRGSRWTRSIAPSGTRSQRSYAGAAASTPAAGAGRRVTPRLA